MKRRLTSLLLAIGIVAIGTQTFAKGKIDADYPNGYSGYITYIGNGVAGLDSLQFVDIGPAAIQCFQDVLGRDQAAIGQHLQDAINYSQQAMGLTVSPLDQYGIPVNPLAPAWAIPYSLRSDVNVRAYVVSGEKVPTSGWPVRDCGWQIVCVNPSGCSLSNDFAGQTLAAGSGFAYGDYIVQGSKKNYVLSFTPAALVDQTATGTYFRWNIDSADFGTCVAQGIISPKLLDTNNDNAPDAVQHNIRNTITCNANGGL